MNVKELENILNSNRLDLRQLNAVQRLFIDKLQKKGIIETKPLDTLEKEQLELAALQEIRGANQLMENTDIQNLLFVLNLLHFYLTT